MKCKAMITSAMLSFSVLTPIHTFAEPPASPSAPAAENGQAKGPGGFFKEVLEGLNLTPEQKEKLKALRENRQSFREKHEELWDRRKELMELIKKPGSTE